MHPQKVLLNVIGSTEVFGANVAVKGLLVPVYVLVSRVQISTIGAVRTRMAHVTFATCVVTAVAAVTAVTATG